MVHHPKCTKLIRSEPESSAVFLFDAGCHLLSNVEGILKFRLTIIVFKIKWRHKSWQEVTLGRRSSAAREWLLPVVAWIDHCSNTSVRALRHGVCHHRLIIGNWSIGFGYLCCHETRRRLPKLWSIPLNVQNLSVWSPNRARFFLFDAECHLLSNVERI